MPELPEVETIRREFDEAVKGQHIETVLWADSRMVQGAVPGQLLGHWLAGQETTQVGRRGKFLLWAFRSGDCLVLHLGMSGRLRVQCQAEAVWETHTHLVVRMDDGHEVRLRDPRRFGRVEGLPAGQEISTTLGPEPLAAAFTQRILAEALTTRRAPVKALLLDQRVVAGIGNIYADEALFRARIHPETPANQLNEGQIAALHRALRHVLREGIRHRGTTFQFFQDAGGREGENAAHLAVYGRMGKPCSRCRKPIETRTVGGRTSHFCPQCQSLNAVRVNGAKEN